MNICVLLVGAVASVLNVKSGSIEIPAEWSGKSVRLEQRTAFCELDVSVNGTKVGIGYSPMVSVEIAPALKFGAANVLKVDERVVADYYGRGDGPFGNKDDARRRRFGSMQLVARTAAYVDDFFVRPSWREKKLFLEVEIESLNACKGEVEALIADEFGRPTIVSGGVSAKLEKGTNVVKFEIPWENPIPWEPVAHPKTYDCVVTLKVNGVACDSNRPHTLFGFREIWREGKEIILNGHIQRFRMFWYQGLPKDANDVHQYGFNLANEAHKHWAYWFEKPEEMEQRSRAGIAVFSGMPSIYFVHDKIRTDPKCTAEFKRSLKAWMRTWRNYPCIVAASCGVNQICPERNMRPELLGQDLEKGGVVDNIEFARKLAREMNPNALYYSHADGTEADISSSNLYFNFTPLQEREEWLSQWATNGILPWCAVEFGSPYYACWFHSRVPEATEWLAVYYGDKAYAAENEQMLKSSKAFAKSCLRFTHGGWLNDKGGDGTPGPNSIYKYNSLAEEYSRMLVYRTNRAWRNYGQNCGMMYLISWNWDAADGTEDGIVRTRQMQANGDLVTWLGGAGDPTDRTHAYFAGEEIEKQVVLCWDGLGENVISYKVQLDGATIFEGSKTLKQGDIVRVPFKFTAAQVSKKRAFKLTATFKAAKGMENRANRTTLSDTFDFEVYPKLLAKALGPKSGVVLFDPAHQAEAMLSMLGVAFTSIENLAEAKDAQYLILGPRALSNAQGLEKLAGAIAKGLKVLVLQQEPAVWQSMGFKIEDSMARQMFNISLSGLDNSDLAHWRGDAAASVPFGNVMKHETRRGPRWTHHHAISATPILIPQRAGFKPLVRGEFDLSYTALLEEFLGEGSVLFSAFDFANRVGVCPAATTTAKAMLEHFFNEKAPAHPTIVYTSGATAERLAKTMGIDAKPFNGDDLEDDELLLVGPDSKLTYEKLDDYLDDGAVYVFANPRIAVEAGIAAQTTDVYRVTNFAGFEQFPFAGIGPSLLRWRDKMSVVKFEAKNGFKVAGEGLFARKKNLFFDATNPFQLADRYRTNGAKAAHLERGGWGSVPKGEKDLYLRNASQSEDNHMRRLALVFANLGVGASESQVKRSLYTKPSEMFEPISQYNVLGPWPSERDDDHYMVDTIFPVDESKGGDSGKLAEEMAIKGDVQPNPRFHPLGLKYLDETPHDLRFLDWRPVVKSRADGYVDYATASPLIAAQSFCTCYCVGFFKRRTAGEITIRFGVDWRGKLWVNGEPLEPVYGGHKDEGSKIYEHVKVRAGDNYISVKAGCGQSAKMFWLNISHELGENEILRERVPELDSIDLYESANTQFDPYEYVYW